MNYLKLRELMVSQQIEKRGIKNKAVLRAMRHVPRHLFTANKYLNEVYCDYPLPIGFKQTISRPYLVALMTDRLRLESHHKVLEVGTGCGYQTAVLAEIVKDVYTAEIIPQLAERANKNLHQLGYENIHNKQGDGLTSWEGKAPFDRIIVTAAPHKLPQALVKQLKINGYMIIPVGLYPQILYRIFRKSEQQIEQQIISHVAFVPMTGAVAKL